MACRLYVPYVLCVHAGYPIPSLPTYLKGAGPAGGIHVFSLCIVFEQVILDIHIYLRAIGRGIRWQAAGDLI